MLSRVLFRSSLAWERRGKGTASRKRGRSPHVVLTNLERVCGVHGAPRAPERGRMPAWNGARSQAGRCFVTSPAERHAGIPARGPRCRAPHPFSPRSQPARPAIPPASLCRLASLLSSSPQRPCRSLGEPLPHGLRCVLFLIPDLLYSHHTLCTAWSILGVRFVTAQLPNKVVKVLKSGIVLHFPSVPNAVISQPVLGCTLSVGLFPRGTVTGQTSES